MPIPSTINDLIDPNGAVIPQHAKTVPATLKPGALFIDYAEDGQSVDAIYLGAEDGTPIEFTSGKGVVSAEITIDYGSAEYLLEGDDGTVIAGTSSIFGVVFDLPDTLLPPSNSTIYGIGVRQADSAVHRFSFINSNGELQVQVRDWATGALINSGANMFTGHCYLRRA